MEYIASLVSSLFNLDLDYEHVSGTLVHGGSEFCHEFRSAFGQI